MSLVGASMSELAEVIRLIEKQLKVREARCAIADEGFPPESSIFGTRDGYLNVAMALLRFVDSSDGGKCWTQEGHAWDDGIKDTLYQLPTLSAWLVGAYLFKSHIELMAALTKVVDPQIESPLANDPQFQDPSGENSK